MKLTKLKINDFRAIRSLEIYVHDFLTLIGPNNSGKSSILRAIEIFLNQVKPEPDEFRKNSEAPIRIEGVFEGIQEWERNKPGVSSLVNDNRIQLRVTIAKDGDSVGSLDYEAYIRPAIIVGWADRWTDLGADIQEVARELNIDGRGWRTKANQERVRERIIEQNPSIVSYGEAEWTSEGISIAPALKQAIPQVVMVHAVRDASDESKPATKTPFGILMKKIILPAIQESGEYQNLVTAVEELAIRMKGEGEEGLAAVNELAEELTRTISAILEARVVFKIDTPDTDKFIGANTGINLDDGIELPIHLQGHGAQRALIYALVESLARRNAALEVSEEASNDELRSTVLLFEEPEIYLHPHLLRRLKKSLSEIAQQADWQVVVSTHSPFFIEVADNPTSLVILSKSSHESGVAKQQLETDPFIDLDGEYNEREALRAALDFHPSVAEAFFANRVVLVEGDTELAVLKHSKELCATMGVSEEKFDSTTIVSCGGKWTIPAMAKLMSQFGLPFRIIHDMDRKGLTDDELATISPIHPFRANEKIENAAGGAPVYQVEDTFEDVLWPDSDDAKFSDKPYRAWRRSQEIAEGTIPLTAVPGLQEIYRFTYDW